MFQWLTLSSMTTGDFYLLFHYFFPRFSMMNMYGLYNFFFNIYLFIWLRWVLVGARRIFIAACGIFQLQHVGSQLQHAGSSSLTRDQTQAPYTGSVEF